MTHAAAWLSFRGQLTPAGFIMQGLHSLIGHRLDDKVLIGIVHSDGSEEMYFLRRIDFYSGVYETFGSKPQRAYCRNCLLHMWNDLEIKAKLCSRCRTTYYCSERCQRIDWCIHRHECCHLLTEADISAACKTAFLGQDTGLPVTSFFACLDTSDLSKNFSLDEFVKRIDQQPLRLMCDPLATTCMLDVSSVDFGKQSVLK